MAAPGVQVTKEEAHRFAQVWRYKGIVILMDDAHLQFATDFANAAVKSLLDNVRAAQAAKAAKAKPIVEGVNEHTNISEVKRS